MIGRWQDWTDVVLGGWLVVSPWQMGYTLNQTATTNACGLGTVLIVFNLISACRLVDQGQEIFNILLGLWLICSPYVLGFTTDKEPAINTVAAGVMVVGLAVWQIYDAIRSGKK
jgi:hypothetical protein